MTHFVWSCLETKEVSGIIRRVHFYREQFTSANCNLIFFSAIVCHVCVMCVSAFGIGISIAIAHDNAQYYQFVVPSRVSFIYSTTHSYSIARHTHTQTSFMAEKFKMVFKSWCVPLTMNDGKDFHPTNFCTETAVRVWFCSTDRFHLFFLAIARANIFFRRNSFDMSKFLRFSLREQFRRMFDFFFWANKSVSMPLAPSLILLFYRWNQ